MTREELAALLRPVDVPGEPLRFGLAGFRSVVTRELLLIRMRRQAQVFGTGEALVAARISADGAHLAVDGAALAAANAAAATRLETAAGALDMLRRFARTERALGSAAEAFERALASRVPLPFRGGVGVGWLRAPSLEAATPPPAPSPRGRGDTPSRLNLLAYIDANTTYQELGALKFCMPTDLRARVAAIVDDAADALLAPEHASLWSQLHARELALARARLVGSAARYRRALGGYRRSVGYLGAEDVAFEPHEQADAIDERIAGLGTDANIGAARAALAAARARDRAARRTAAARFGAARPDAALMALVLLARTLAAHEDRNRRAKMRLLRDLRDLADRAGLAIATASLLDLAAACGDGHVG